MSKGLLYSACRRLAHRLPGVRVLVEQRGRLTQERDELIRQRDALAHQLGRQAAERAPLPGAEGGPQLGLTPDRVHVLAARYGHLKTELAGLIATGQPPALAEEQVRHAHAGSIKLFDAVILAELLARLKPARILEVGSFIGFSTRWLLECSRESNAAVVAVDPDIRHRVFDRPGELLRRFNAADLGSRLRVTRGFFGEAMSGDYYYDYEHYPPFVPREEVDQIMRSRPVLNGGNLGEGQFDFVFIDGDHTEGAVLSNFAAALPVLKPNGCVAFHDAVSWPSVARALATIAHRYAAAGCVEVYGRGVHEHGHAALCDGIGVFHASASPRTRGEA